MGSSKSKTQDAGNLQSTYGKIATGHYNIKKIHKYLVDEGNKIIDEIHALGFDPNSPNNICQRLVYIRMTELPKFFPPEVIDKVAYRVGISVDDESTRTSKKTICQKLTEFLVTKIKLILAIEDAISTCQQTDYAIWLSLTQDLSKKYNRADQINIYDNALAEINKIQKLDSQLNTYIVDIRNAGTYDEIGRIQSRVNPIVLDVKTKCAAGHGRIKSLFNKQPGLFREQGSPSPNPSLYVFIITSVPSKTVPNLLEVQIGDVVQVEDIPIKYPTQVYVKNLRTGKSGFIYKSMIGQTGICDPNQQDCSPSTIQDAERINKAVQETLFQKN